MLKKKTHTHTQDCGQNTADHHYLLPDGPQIYFLEPAVNPPNDMIIWLTIFVKCLAETQILSLPHFNDNSLEG